MTGELVNDLGYLALGAVVGAMAGWELHAMKYARDVRRILDRIQRQDETRDDPDRGEPDL